jgi:phage tail sheath gpL-like
MGIMLPTGWDPQDPTPRNGLEVAFGRGSAGGQSQSRKALIICNKVSSVGSGSVDGLGSTLNTPVDILGGEAEVIQRAGYHSEALLLYRLFVRYNKTTQVALAIVPPGTGSGTFTWTFATNSNASGSVKIYCNGEAIEVGVASGDTPDTVKTNVIAAVNAQLHWTVVASSGGVGIVTITSAIAGTRHDHALNMASAAMTLPNAMTVTKSAVTPGSTDDDQTTLISNLEQFDYYYQVNPKQVATSVTSTDNGIGEHAAAMATWVQANLGKNCVLIIGSTTTPANAVTVAQSINQPWAFVKHQEDNYMSPGQLAVHFAAILAGRETTQRAAYMAGYGLDEPLDILPPPDPADRPTAAEIKTMLQGGVSPIAFKGDRPYFVWPVTTKSLTNSIADYRSRPGQIPSVGFDLRDALLTEWNAERQDFFADDPAEGDLPQVNFTYKRDVRSLIARVLRNRALGLTGQTTLDPGELDNMIASIVVNKTTTGFAANFDYVPVKHLLISSFVAQDVGPSI